MEEPIKCIGRRRLHISKDENNNVVIKLTQLERYIATLTLTKEEAIRLVMELQKWI